MLRPYVAEEHGSLAPWGAHQQVETSVVFRVWQRPVLLSLRERRL